MASIKPAKRPRARPEPTAQPAALPAVCITGMHRSGTSMVARLLSVCGLWLGPPEQLMPARADNPDGFFEHLEMVSISDQLIERFAGGWDMLPDWPVDWQQSPIARELLPAAQALVARLSAPDEPHPAWGWKDPRVCLTLPFWQTVLPEQRVLVCLRHPVSVARSLHQRGSSSLRFGVCLWEAYNRMLMAALPANRFLVTHYDAWFVNPQAELERVLDFLGIVPDAKAAAAALALVRSDARHHAAGDMAQLAALGGPSARALYDRMRARCGPVYEASVEGALAAPSPVEDAQAPAAPGADPVAMLGHLQHQFAALRRQNAELALALEGHERPIGRYRLGDTIDARAGGAAPLFLGSGWGEPDIAGTWSVGPVAKLDLLLTQPVQEPLRLVVRLMPLVAPRAPEITVELLANGHAAAQFRLNTFSLCTLQAELPPSRDGHVHLVFRIREPRSPRDLDMSADLRPLGVLLIDLRLVAAPDPGAAA